MRGGSRKALVAAVWSLVLGLAWITTTGLAYAAVLNKQMVLHKEWMIRSYVVTFRLRLLPADARPAVCAWHRHPARDRQRRELDVLGRAAAHD